MRPVSGRTGAVGVSFEACVVLLFPALGLVWRLLLSPPQSCMSDDEQLPRHHEIIVKCVQKINSHGLKVLIDLPRHNEIDSKVAKTVNHWL